MVDGRDRSLRLILRDALDNFAAPVIEFDGRDDAQHLQAALAQHFEDHALSVFHRRTQGSRT